MDTTSKVLNIVTPGDWAVSLDLSDAYLHIPIFPKHQKYLRFSIQGRAYQFKALCFGPTSAPSFQKSCISSCSLSESKKHTPSSISRRLVISNTKEIASDIRSKPMSQSPDRNGVHCEQRKVQSVTKSGVDIFGRIFLFKEGFTLSNTRKDSKIEFSYANFAKIKECNNIGIYSFVGDNGFMHRINSQCSSFYETNSITSFGIFENLCLKIWKWKFLLLHIYYHIWLGGEIQWTRWEADLYNLRQCQ